MVSWCDQTGGAHGEREERQRIDVGVRRPDKWSGIAACAGRLYCAPCNESSVLVIDPATNTVRTIECGVSGDGKWCGIAACDGRL
mgnify:CR=1 FL=1